MTTLDAYRALFDGSGDRVPIDFSPSCFRSHVAVDRIREFLPDAGVLIVLRDPVARAWSAYQNRIRKGYERRAPDEALVRGERSIDMGFYNERIVELRDAFGAARVRVWLFDDLVTDPAGVVGEVLRHVGADPSEAAFADVAAHNRAHVPRSQMLHRLFPNHAQRRAILRRVPRSALKPLEFVWRANQRDGDAIPAPTAERLRTLYAEDITRLQETLQRDLTAWRIGSA